MDRAQSFMASSFVASALAHALIILAVGISIGAPKMLFSSQPLEVVLVNQRTTTAPAKADALAQAQLDGGGNTDATDKRVKSPLPSSSKDPSVELEQMEARQRQLEQTSLEMLTRVQAQVALAQAEAQRAQEQRKEGRDLEALQQRARELAAQAAQISKENQIYQSRPKKTFIGARTSEYRFAKYIDNWRIKVERYGTMLIPKGKDGRPLHGNLGMTVEIDARGNLVSASIFRSSGNPELDAGALRIAKMAAPYDVLGKEISKDTDILSISRTWNFGKAGDLETALPEP
ncbi:protein TonB [Andreprevotia lacus DSM 23236]|uniref:Protein TonB n=1 Tax=Andreprevotia lacus DSM 23236 TaxID=1121001 RepID=A0A1W1Y072_9NEIS|nr:energy transducer TonB [Andreprevotia lacus]SMC29619.1 protein TonB [Andreprevotia lacus DSM 23236]